MTFQSTFLVLSQCVDIRSAPNAFPSSLKTPRTLDVQLVKKLTLETTQAWTLPPNYFLRASIEKSLQLCKDHHEELKYVCLQDRVKICTTCALFGEHKNHEIKPLSDLQPEMDKKIQEVEGLLQLTGEYHKNTKNVYEDERKAALKTIESRFRELQFMLKAKETEFAYKINSFFDNEIEKMDSQVGENSLASQMLSKKLSEYKQMMKCSNPFKLLEEDFSAIKAIKGIIQEALCSGRTQKIDKLLKQINQDVDSTLKTQLTALGRIEVRTKKLELVRKETNIKLDEKLFTKPEFIESQLVLAKAPSLAQSGPTDITIQEDQINISYPFSVSANKNFDILDELGEKMALLQFTISKDIEKMTQEDISQLCYIRSKLPKVEDIEVFLENYKISDEALLDIFSGLYWKNDSLTGLQFNSKTKGVFDKSLLYLAESVLPSVPHLRSVSLWLQSGEVSRKAWITLTQSISQIAERLTCLHFSLPSRYIDAGSLQKLFVSMPNLESFAYRPSSEAFDDQVLEAFISSTLPSLKKLKVFQLFIQRAAITDLTVQKLFSTFPQAWFSTLDCFDLSIANTKLTDKSLEDFIEKSLKEFKTLTEFSISANNSNVSSVMKTKIAEWEQTLATKQSSESG